MFNSLLRRNLLQLSSDNIFKNYLTVNAVTDITIDYCQYYYTTYYCVNGDGNWKKVEYKMFPFAVNKSNSISFKSTRSSTSSSENVDRFEITGNFTLSGNCMSMLFGDDAASNTSLAKYPYCFEGLFGYDNCPGLMAVSDDFLPATTLAEYCYLNMFYYCTGLKTAPNLPATTLKDYCYRYMFYNCSSLTKAPLIGATTLATGCCESMFSRCTSLTRASDLIATTLVTDCYRYMFLRCSKLLYVKALFTTTPDETYAYYWLLSVSSTGTFVKNINATWKKPSLDYYGIIPTNWTISYSVPNLDNYLTIEALEDNLTVKFTNTLEYSADGIKWTSLLANTETNPISIYTKMYFRGNLIPNEVSGIGTFIVSKKFKISGNCMSLLYKDTSSKTLKNKDFAFKNLFKNCDKLIGVSETLLPATTLSESCYEGMFENCINLKNSPNLNVTTLTKACYKRMFYNCNSLTDIPLLPATTLSESCYEGMFYNCNSVIGTGDMPALTMYPSCYKLMFSNCNNLFYCQSLQANKLASSCYYEMFKNCTSLETIPELPATDLEESCYEGMFEGCTSIVTAPQLSAVNLANNCYKQMFKNCSNLTNIPNILPATALYLNCYDSMFYGCINIETAPELPSSVLFLNCYKQMFYNCSKLNYIKALFTDCGDDFTLDWVYGVSVSGTFIKNKNLQNSLLGNSGIPVNWEVSECMNIHDYLTIEALANSLTVKLSVNNCEYCIDGNDLWVLLTAGTATPSISKGLFISFKGNLTPVESSGIGTFTVSLSFNLLGNCMSMLFGDDGYINKSLEGKNYAFFSLFKSLTKLLNVSLSFLPATTLSEHCYYNMFYGCTALKNAPNFYAENAPSYCCYGMFYNCSSIISIPAVIPATILGSNCYLSMFRGCSKITTMPELPATELATYCYSRMFLTCTSLVNTSALSALTLASYCYEYMFHGCSALTETPELPATELATYCYRYMFYNCSKITKSPKLLALTLKSNCYTYMFGNCSSLNYIEALFTTKPSSSYTSNWVNGVATTGTFVKNTRATWSVSGVSGIPTGWSFYGHLDKYLIIEAAEDNLTAKLSVNTCEYCIDDDTSTWYSLPPDTETLPINTGLYLMFKGNITPTSSNGVGTFTVSKKFNLLGRGLALLYGVNSLNKTTAGSSSLRYLFKNCTTLIKVSDTFLPYTKVNSAGYNQMFYGCSSLTKAPNLPATTLASNCYAAMFRGCTSLTKAPSLEMDTLVDKCFVQMFYGCSKLKSITMTATTIPATTCFTSWVNGVAASGTFTKSTDVEIPTGESGIPEGWTITNV